ncbi:hypothetical protein [Variovorax paradoxus]|uniref:hypothetical protein n=1 Tax=Variovorax paradoxus TaxID=34073 RepID=UPI003D646440
MELLARLCCAHLPLKIHDLADIEKCDVLRAEQLIEADVPFVLHERGRSAFSGQATVMRVTAKGLNAAKQRG